MEAWPRPVARGNWPDRARNWLAANDDFHRYVLTELERHGPLPSRHLEDRSTAPWESTGWTHGRNVNRMLEFLSAKGEVAVSGRRGAERLWDLAARVFPVDTPRLSPAEAEAGRQRRRLAALGIARPAEVGDAGAPAGVEGVRGQWRVEPALIDRPFAGRTAVLSPFDRLVYDRSRALALFDFEFALEIYTPPAKRRWGYYVLPILNGDRLIGKADARADREAGVLRVPALHVEHGSTADDMGGSPRRARGAGPLAGPAGRSRRRAHRQAVTPRVGARGHWSVREARCVALTARMRFARSLVALASGSTSRVPG